MKLKKPMFFHTAFDTYSATEVLGSGGSGRVYSATDEDGQPRAIELLTALPKNKVKRFRNELMFCMEEKHDGIISIIDHGIWDDGKLTSPFYVMPLYDENLRDVIARGIPVQQILQYFGQMLNAVEAAHLKGVVHRDIKPENFLYRTADKRLVLADFGIAHFQEEDLWTAVETKADERLANFKYRAPEQLVRGSQADARSDIYALGLILNEMFTGHVPQGEEYPTIGSLQSEYMYLDGLVSSMLKYDCNKRPQSIDQIKQLLIGRRNEFISRQRLSKLTQTAVVTTDVDDPLVADPPRIVAADWDSGRLTIILSQEVNSRWRSAILHMGSYTSQYGMEPKDFVVHGNRAMIDVDDHNAQAAIDYFKKWLPQINSVYESTLRRDLELAEQKARRKLQEEIEEQEKRHKVSSNLKI